MHGSIDVSSYVPLTFPMTTLTFREEDNEPICWIDRESGELHFAQGWYAEKVLRWLFANGR